MEPCAIARKKAKHAAIKGMLSAAFFKEDLELACSLRAFGVTGRSSLPPPLIYVEEIDDHLSLPLSKAQARELMSLGKGASGGGEVGDGGKGGGWGGECAGTPPGKGAAASESTPITTCKLSACAVADRSRPECGAHVGCPAGAAAVVNAPKVRIDSPAFEAALDDLINGQLHEGLELEKTCKPLRKELRRLLVFGSGYSHTIKGPQV